MPYDSEGNFYRVHNWEEDRINDIDIVADRHDEEDDNFANGLSNCMLRDGRCTMTGNLKMGTFQIKEVANGTISTDAVNKGQLDSAKSELTSNINTLLGNLYPVGSLYIGTQATCPLATLIAGSQWQLVAQNRALWGGNGGDANTTIEAGLPNITGTTKASYGVNNTTPNSGALSSAIYTGGSASGKQDGGSGNDGEPIQSSTISFNASSSNSIYGRSSTVQPPAYRVNVWRRTA